MRVRHAGQIAALSLAAVGLSVLYWWYSGPPIKPEVSSRLAAAVQAGDTLIELNEVALFDWSDVYIIPPYTTKARAEKAMGVSWPWRWSAIEFRDEFMLLVFLDSGRVVGIVEHPRNPGDFAPVAKIQRYTRSNARFAVRRSATTGSWVFLPSASRD